MRDMVEVLIRDGNRTTNMEFSEGATIRTVLETAEFEWVPDSVVVCGEWMPDNTLDIPLSQFVDEPYRDGVIQTIRITVIAPKKELPRKNKTRTKEDRANVR